MEEESKNKRVRRTRAEIEADLFDAVRELAGEKGLGQISFADLVQRTGTQMSVLLNNYKSIEQVLDKYAYVSDYWLHDLFNNEHPTDRADEEVMKTTLKSLAANLYDNIDMQHLLIWELEADNATTRSMARSREKHYKAAIEEYNHLFEGTDIPIDIIIGLLTAGTYYLILHRRRSTFCGVDYQRKESRKRLYDTLEYLIGLLFDELREHRRITEIARNLQACGVADDVIEKCTGIRFPAPADES